jgi:hypothetical protein
MVALGPPDLVELLAIFKALPWLVRLERNAAAFRENMYGADTHFRLSFSIPIGEHSEQARFASKNIQCPFSLFTSSSLY